VRIESFSRIELIRLACPTRGQCYEITEFHVDKPGKIELHPDMLVVEGLRHIASVLCCETHERDVLAIGAGGGCTLGSGRVVARRLWVDGARFFQRCRRRRQFCGRCRNEYRRNWRRCHERGALRKRQGLHSFASAV
jgi:hypothetical protein